MSPYVIKISKNRGYFPAQAVKELVSENGRDMVLTYSLFGRKLLLYNSCEFKTFEEKLLSAGPSDQQVRAIQRFLIGNARDTELKSNGKMTVPKAMMDWAGLGSQAILLQRKEGHELWSPKIFYNHLVEQDVKFDEKIVDKVFVSYSSNDRKYVVQIMTDLEKLGVDLWIDYNELLPGDSLIESIQDAITNSPFFIVILSESSVASKWCKKELQQALNEEIERNDVFVIPIVIDECSIPGFIRDKVYADLRPQQYDLGIKLLARRFLG